MRQADLTGQKFGRLTAIEATDTRVANKIMWRCLCDCGAETLANVQQLRGGQRVSCGCAKLAGNQVNKKKPKHGHCVNGKDSAYYRVWGGMWTRCTNPKTQSYPNYGGRGISVCERWKAFENFLADMGDRPKGGTLERIDVNGNYEPGNCRWATWKEQGRNKRTNHVIAAGGKTAPISEWAEELGLNKHTIGSRIRKQGLTHEEAVSTKVMTKSEAAILGNQIRWGNRQR